MINLFKVSDLNFIDSADEFFRFVPSEKISHKYQNNEIIKRLFTENVTVNPEPDTYPEIIQRLIDTEPQPSTAAEVAKILSLYNPADISAILRQLINTEPQPSTAEAICHILRLYPYEDLSPIYDYKFLQWAKVGSGTITRDDDTYTFANAGVQKATFIPQLNGHTTQIKATVKMLDISRTQLLFTIYNTTHTTSTAYPQIWCIYRTTLSSNNNFFYPEIRTTNNGSVTRGTIGNLYGNPDLHQGDIGEITFTINSDGTLDLRSQKQAAQKSMFTAYTSNTNTLNLRNIRICANINPTISYFSGIEIQKFQITYDGTIISQWNK